MANITYVPGKTLCILGTSASGPVNEPVAPKNPNVAKSIFGTEGTLYRKYKEAYDYNPDLNIYLVRINGQHAEGELRAVLNDRIVPGIKFRAAFGGNSGNSIKVTVTTVLTSNGQEPCLIIEHPDYKQATYLFSRYSCIGKLVDAINIDATNGIVPVIASSSFYFEPTTILLGPNPLPVTLSGGEDGLTLSKNDIYLALESTYRILEGQPIDVIVLTAAYFDDTHAFSFYGVDTYGSGFYSSNDDYLDLYDTYTNTTCTFHNQLIEFCHRQQQFGYFTHGVISLRPVNPELVNEKEFSYLTALVNETAFRYRYGLVQSTTNSISDYGYFISVVAGEFLFPDGYYDTTEAVYGAMICSLNPEETTTNKSVRVATSQKWEVSTREAKELAALGVVTYRTSVKYGLVVNNGVTAAIHSHELHYLINLRQVQITLATINSVIQQFIGESTARLMLTRSIEAAVKDNLRWLRNAKVIKDYEYNIKYYPQSGRVDINLKILPVNAVEYISCMAYLRTATEGVA